jgi:hypothetical protein
LDLLKETIESQIERTKNFKYLWPGAAINFLYFEEERPLQTAKNALTRGDTEAARKAVAPIRERLTQASSETLQAIDQGSPESAAASLENFMANIPASFWPSDKIGRVIDVFDQAGVDGFALFCVGHLDPYAQWDTLRTRLKG